MRAARLLVIIEAPEKRAGVVQWQYRSFPSFGRGFDSHRPLQKPRVQPEHIGDSFGPKGFASSTGRCDTIESGARRRFRRGLSDPGYETRLAESRAIAGN